MASFDDGACRLDISTLRTEDFGLWTCRMFPKEVERPYIEVSSYYY